MIFTKEFKEAIVHLTVKEKDKLLLRLLKKDENLANRLFFELVDDKTVDEKRLDMEGEIKTKVMQISNSFYSSGYLLMDIKDISGSINSYVRITKDKYGEASLNLLMLNKALILNNTHLINGLPNKALKLHVYIITRAFKILTIIRKLHEDCEIDFMEDLLTLGKLISKNIELKEIATQNGFDVNWLLKGDFPENIAQIHKVIKSRPQVNRRFPFRSSIF